VRLLLTCFWIALQAARAGPPAVLPGDDADSKLRRLFEACRTCALVTGRFPTNYRDLDGMLSHASRRQMPEGVEFENPESPDNRLRRRSPVGERTPCLRLRVGENDWLNVACTGWIYRSGEYWESEFVDLIPRPLMWVELLAKDHRPVPQRAARRSPLCGSAQIELVPKCNAIPTFPWFFGPPHEKSAPDFGSWVADGVHEHDGVLFDVRGVIQLDGRMVPKATGKRFLRAYPENVRGIAVGKSARVIHLLAGTVDRAEPRAVVATVRVAFTSGASEELPLRYGEHFASASDPPGESPRLYPPAGKDSYYSLHHVRLNNPRPGDSIEHIDFSSGRTTSHPFIMAMTIEP
jgi:hypothetical protein